MAQSGQGSLKTQKFLQTAPYPAMSDSHLNTSLILIEILRKIPKTAYTSAEAIQQHLHNLGHPLTIRSVQRHLQTLCQHFDIECDDRSKPYGYRWKSHARGLRMPILTEQESLMLMLARRHLENLLPVNVMNAVRPFFDEAANKLVYGQPEYEWLGKVAVAPTSQPLLPAPIADGVLEAAGLALYENRWLRLRYRNQSGYENDYRVMPLGLVQQGETLYLVVRFAGHEDEQHLALHRILQAAVSTESFQRPQFKLHDYCAAGHFGFGDGKTIRLTFSISRTAGFHLTQTKLAANQIILQETPEHYRFQAELPDSAMLDWWLMKFGEDVWDVEKEAI